MKYFFHVEDGTCIRDPNGEEFADDAAAMFEAVRVAHELSKAPIHAHNWRVVVKNADGLRVGTVPLRPELAANDQDAPVQTGTLH